jgi:hypothetical protein
MGLPDNRAPRAVAEPTLDEVMRLVEPADTGGHWYWLGDVARDGIDPVPVAKQGGCQWVVIRLLLPTKGRVRRVNRCGLRTCVNPGHWDVVPVGDGVVLTDFDGAGWRRA